MRGVAPKGKAEVWAPFREFLSYSDALKWAHPVPSFNNAHII